MQWCYLKYPELKTPFETKKKASCWENCSHGRMSRVRSRTAISVAKVLMKGCALILDINYDSALKVLRSIRIISIKTYSVTSFYYWIFFIFFFHCTSSATINMSSLVQLFSCLFVFLFQPREDKFIRKREGKRKGKRKRKE